MRDPIPENTEYFLTLRRPGEGLDIARQIYPQVHEGTQSFRLADLASIARGMRTEAGEDRGTVTLDIRRAPDPIDLSHGSRIQTFADDRVAVDLDVRHMRVDGHPKRLTPMQFRLAAILSSQVNRVFTHDELMDQLQETRRSADSKLADHVSRLRKVLGPELREAIMTCHGKKGYLARSTLK